MISCKDVTKKICENSKDTSLTKRLEIKLHLLICKSCMNYKKTMEFIVESAKKIISDKSNRN